MSVLVKHVLNAMERIAPLRLAEKWDNVGLLLESPIVRPNANRVILTIDLTTAVLQESLDSSVALVVAYHPPIFKPLSSLTLSNPLQATLLHLAASGVSVYSPHTALDNVHGGVNDWLAQCAATPENASTPTSVHVAPLGEPSGDGGRPGRLLTLPDSVSIEILVGRIKKHLRLPFVNVGRPGVARDVKTIAICAGAGGSILGGVDADVYFTGEMSHHQVLEAVAAGRYVVLCGHTHTERGYLPVLASKLTQTLAEIANETETERDKELLKHVDVFVSWADTHPLERM